MRCGGDHQNIGILKDVNLGIIALQVAACYPEYVEHVVIHETPTISLMVGESSEQIALHSLYTEPIKQEGSWLLRNSSQHPLEAMPSPNRRKRTSKKKAKRNPRLRPRFCNYRPKNQNRILWSTSSLMRSSYSISLFQAWPRFERMVSLLTLWKE
jgi:hypothetical protein